MRWSMWTRVMAVKATPEQLMPGSTVYFRRGNVPERGRIAAVGDDARAPLMLLGIDGSVSTRRAYWRNRSQLYVKKLPEDSPRG